MSFGKCLHTPPLFGGSRETQRHLESGMSTLWLEDLWGVVGGGGGRERERPSVCVCVCVCVWAWRDRAKQRERGSSTTTREPERGGGGLTVLRDTERETKSREKILGDLLRKTQAREGANSPGRERQGTQAHDTPNPAFPQSKCNLLIHFEVSRCLLDPE